MKYAYIFLCLFYCNESIAQTKLDFGVADAPRIFGPSVISDGLDNRDMTISPANDELLFTVQHRYGLFSCIFYSRKHNGEWSTPVVAWFSGKYNDLEAAFSPDGKKLYFTSNRPLNQSDSIPKDYDIWFMERKGDQWDGPFNAGPVINSKKDEFYPCLTRSGNLYFTRDNGDSKDDIFLSLSIDGKFQPPSALPSTINSNGYDFNAFVDPDENYMLFTSYRRSDDLGGGDLYCSLRKDGQWQHAVHLDYLINSSALDYSPFVSFDKKYFFFTSKRSGLHFPLGKKANAAEIKTMLGTAGNGSDDIYILGYEALKKYLK